jgi:hypothetical protein
MDEYFVVVDENGDALQWDSSPWGDGDCLVDDSYFRFTVFVGRKEANRVLRKSRAYAKKYNLTPTWHTEDWKVVPLGEYLEK